MARPKLRSVRIRDLPHGDEKVKAVQSMFDAVAPRYELVNRVMTFGLDTGWRRRTLVELRLQPGSVVVDLASGTGDLARDLLRSGHRPIGIDYSYGMLTHAHGNYPLVQGDGLAMPFPEGSVDGAVCGFALRNFKALPPMFAELARIVRPGGRIALVDAWRPNNPLMRMGHGVYFNRVVPVIGGLFGSSAEAYSYLPLSLSYMPPGPTLLEWLSQVGFCEARQDLLSGGIAHLLTATRR